MILIRFFTLLAAVFLFTTYAAPVEDEKLTPPELTGENFDETTAKGIWWIKYYSPYCHHCKTFAPIWNSLYAKLKDNNDDLHFASVNCVSQGDLCSRKDVGVYPTINLYKDGLLMENQKGIKSASVMEKFIANALKEFAENDAKKEVSTKTEANDGKSASPTDTKNTETKSGSFPTFPHSTEIVNTKYPDSVIPATKLSGDVPNPKGLSVPLDYKEFTRRVTATRNGWFIQFYSSKSRHSRDLSPAWNQLAREAKGKLNIGHVNCDVEKRLCKNANISEYPTLKYFASSIQTEYKGLRGIGDLLHFLKCAVEVHSPRSIDFLQYQQLLKGSEDVTLLYIYDHNTAMEDFQAFEKLGAAIIGTVEMAITNDTRIIGDLKEAQLPALYAISKDKSVRFPAKTSESIRKHNDLVDWATRNRLPLVPQLTPITAQDIFANSVVVLALLDPREEADTASAIKELKAVAQELQALKEKEEREELEELRKKKQLKIDEAKDKNDEAAEDRANEIVVEPTPRQPISVAWIDAVFWERWVRGRYGSYDGKSRVIINKENSGKFWDKTVSGDVLVPSRSSIMETLEAALGSSSRLSPMPLHNSVSAYISQTRETLFANSYFYFFLGGAFIVTYLYKKHHGKKREGHATEGLLGKLD